jgi:hypothetical protein
LLKVLTIRDNQGQTQAEASLQLIQEPKIQELPSGVVDVIAEGMAIESTWYVPLYVLSLHLMTL